MAQVKQHRISIQHPATPRSHSSSSLASVSSSPRPRRINVNLPTHSATAAAFHSSTSGTSTLSLDKVQEERARYAELVLNNTISEAFLKMPNVATKPRSADDIPELESTESCTASPAICRLPSVPPAPFTNQKVSFDAFGQPAGSFSPTSSQRPGFDHRRSSQRASSIGHPRTPNTATDIDKEGTKRSSMNPMAATFTPTFPKPTPPDGVASDHGGDTRPPLAGGDTTDARDSVVSGLGISSPTAELSLEQQQQGPDVNTTAQSPTSLTRQDHSKFAESSSVATTVAPTVPTADVDTEELGETGLDRHSSQMVSTTSSLPQSSSSPVDLSIDGTDGMSNLSAEETSIILQLKKMLRNTNAELDRIKDKCQELRDNNQKLELQNVQAVHQITKLQDFEQNNQFLLSRVKELEASGPSLDSVLETASMNGRRQNGSHRQQSSYDSASQIQQNEELKQEVASITSERDALAHKIRAWELGKKPYAQQQQQELRSVHYIDLENERNRLLEELSQKTVFTEEVLTKNENLTVRSKEYEKRVWELEEQVCKLEAERSTLPRSRAELIELEARAEAADAMAEKLQDLEGQATLVKNFQERINELETTNAELEHSNWKLTENLNVVNHQHTLLSKEFESFRSKDKDDRRLEYLATRNRELETILADQPNFKEEYERVSLEMDKLKVKLPQLEGQAKQVTLLRARVLQLEKQIKTMEDLHPRLGEMQQLHERNLFLEEELGELEHLRARELELEQELQESKARLIQLETNKTRMNSFSGLKQQTRARSGSVAQHGPPLPFGLLQQQQQQHQAQHAPIAENESLGAAADLVNKIGGNVPLSHLARSSLVAGGSMDSIQAPRREFPPAVVNGGSSGGPSWPSGRSSVSMSNASHRISTSSSTSTVLSSSSGTSQQRMSNQGYSAPASPEVTSDEEDKREIEALKRAAAMKEEPGSLVHSGSVPATVA